MSNRRSPIPKTFPVRAAGTWLTAIFATVAFVAVSPAPASAEHFYRESFGSSGEGAGQLSEPRDVVVDNSASAGDTSKGDIYVADAGNHRIDKFNSEGKFILAFGEHVDKTTGANICTAASDDVCQAGVAGSVGGQLTTPAFLAVDSSGGPSNGDVYVADTATNLVSKFDSSGNFISVNSGAAAPTGPFEGLSGIAVDSAGNLFVVIPNLSYARGPEHVAYKFAENGSFLSELTLGELYVVSEQVGIALDSHNDLFRAKNANSPGYESVVKFNSLGEVQGEFASEQPRFLTGLAADPKSNDVFTDNGEVIVDYSSTCEPGHETCVQVDSFGLGHLSGATGVGVAGATNVVYAAVTPADTIAVFTPKAQPVIESTSVINVTNDSADLEAVVNPASLPTSYRFEYVADAAYTESGFTNATDVPSPEGSLGEAAGGIAFGALVQNLKPGTVYHYRIVASNADGVSESQAKTFTTQPAGGELALPDGRHWEMVSPPSKEGALIYPLGSGLFEALNVQASDNGNAIVFMTNAPTEANPAGDGQGVDAIATRGETGWTSRVITPSHKEGTGVAISRGAEYMFFSEDLSLGVNQIWGNFNPLSSEATEQTPYVRTVYEHGNINTLCSTSCYRPLVTASNTPPGTEFGQTIQNGVCIYASPCGPLPVGATPDLSHVLITSEGASLTSAHLRFARGLYEWSNGKLQLVSVEPKEEGGGATYGILGSSEGGWQHAVSDNGSLVVWTTGPRLYLGDTAAGKEEAESIRLDLPQGKAGESSSPQFMTASSDLSRIFFLDSGRLTENSMTNGQPDLYEYNLNAPAGSRLTDLTPGKSAGEAGDVEGVVGASEDGSYVYYAAHGELFEYHNGTTTAIAAPGVVGDGFGGGGDWGALVYRTARVSPNGRWLAFQSSLGLTGYDTRDAVSGAPDEEVYLYNGETHKLVCASCNPTGARPVGRKLKALDLVNADGALDGSWVSATLPTWTRYNVDSTRYQSRFLSNSGRLFFDSNEALVPQDVNGTMDVYEYEAPGEGSCTASSPTFSERSGGCVAMISSGNSPQESSFMDASASGGDVFFLTTASLLTQDVDTAYDIYDAHECTSGVPCYPASPVLPPACDNGESCKAAESPQPAIFGSPSSETFSGAGNVTPSSATAVTKKATKKKTVRCAKGKKLSHGKCVKAKAKGKKARAKKSSNDRRAGR
jgi:hypothetical protein